MKLSNALILGLISVYALGGIAAIAIPLMAEVNISEVEGKYQEPTLEDIIEYNKAEASKVALLGLQMAYRAGYAQATLDCEVHHSTDTK